MKISNIKNLCQRQISLWLKISKFKLPKKKFAKKGRRVVGLDITQGHVIALELTHKGGFPPEVSAFGRAEVKDGGLQEAIRKVAETMQVNSKMVNIALPGSSCLVRYISLPKMTKEEAASSLRFEADKYIPYPVNEVVLDSQILSEGPETKKITVLLVCAKIELVNKYIQMLKGASLDVNIIDIAPMALVNSFLFSEKDAAGGGVIALLDVGRETTDITILKDSLPCLTRAISFGAENKTDLISELRLSFDCYESQFERGIDKIFISGEAAGREAIEAFLQENLRLEVLSWDVTSKLSFGSAVAKEMLAPYVNYLGCAVGLALRI